MPRYLISVPENMAPLLESWFGGALVIGPEIPPVDHPGGSIRISSADAVLEDGELDRADDRLRHSGPRYHAGGPSGKQANEIRSQGKIARSPDGNALARAVASAARHWLRRSSTEKLVPREIVTSQAPQSFMDGLLQFAFEVWDYRDGNRVKVTVAQLTQVRPGDFPPQPGQGG